MKNTYRLRAWASLSAGLVIVPGLLMPQTCNTIPSPPPAAPPPPQFQALYDQLGQDLFKFNLMLNGLWNGSTYPVIFGGNLSNANCNAGPSLSTGGGTALELQALKALGAQAVLVQAGFPILYEPFYDYLASLSPPPPPGFQNLQYQSFVNYYQELAAEVRAAGLKLIVENDVLLSNDVSAGWGPVMGGYYASLNWEQFQAARGQDALTTAVTMQPDYIVVLEEPDSQATQTGQSNLSTVSGSVSLVNTILDTLAPVRGSMKVGAGVETYIGDLQSYIQGFAGIQCSSSQPCVNPPGLDFIDMHIYPINNLGAPSYNNFLQDSLTIASIAASAGKPVSMTEAWMWKMANDEWPNPDVNAINGRNPFNFWAPLDTVFLQTIENLANYTHMLFMTPEGPEYLFAYQPYNSTTAHETPNQIIDAETTLSNQANQTASYTSTGLSYYCSLVSPPDTTPPTAPALIKSSSGAPDQASLSWTSSTDNVGVAGYYILRDGQQVYSTAQTLFRDRGLMASTTYTYEIEAFDLANNVSPALVVTIKTRRDTTPPSVPTNLSGTTDGGQASLSWTASTDVDSPVAGYNVFRNGDQIGTTATNSYQDSGLSPSTTYTYTVSAYDPSGNTSAKSAPVVLTTSTDTQPPSVPQNLTAQVISAGQIDLSWTASTDNFAVAGYYVYRFGAIVGTVSTTSYQDTGLMPDTTYSYWVAAFDASGNISGKSNGVQPTTLPETTPPTVPTNVNAGAVSATQINVTWTASTDSDSPVAGYNVYRNGTMIATTVNPSYQDSGLMPSTTYSYTVSAYDPSGNTSKQSASASATTLPDTMPPSVPTGLAAQAVSSTQVNLSWNPSTDPDSAVAGYNVYRNGMNVGTTSSTKYQDTGLAPNTTYTYAVSAFDAAGNTSARSTSVSITTEKDTTQL